LTRPPQVQGLNGFDALNLWAQHQAGELSALPTLLTYNAYDVINLKPLLELACRDLARQTLERVGLPYP
jgi:hypothetical protein